MERKIIPTLKLNSSTDLTKSLLAEEDICALFKRRSGIHEKFINDLMCGDDNFFNILIHCISTVPRSRCPLENSVIVKYLNILETFINLLKKINCSLKELISTVAYKMEYEFLKKDHILFKFGEKGEKYYIILRGQVSILIAKDIKLDLSEEEYVKYVNKLISNDELELLYRTLIHNNTVYPKVYDKYYKQNIEKARLSRVGTVTTEKNDLPLRRDTINEAFLSTLNKNFNVEEYINNNMPTITNTKRERSSITIFKYFNILTLKSGDAFGEIALTSNSQKRYMMAIN